MKNWKEVIKKDFWVILLDIVAVNLSYLLALLIRFFEKVKSVTVNTSKTAVFG